MLSLDEQISTWDIFVLISGGTAVNHMEGEDLTFELDEEKDNVVAKIKNNDKRDKYE